MARFEVRQTLPTGGSLATVGNVKLPKRFTVHVFEHEDGSPDVDLVFEVRAGVPQCREVHIRATAEGHEVRHSGLAGLRIQDVLEQAVKHLTFGGVTEIEPGQYRVSPYSSPDEQGATWKAVRESRKALRGKGLDLAEVASVYRENVASHPTKAVSVHFQVAHRTAALYVKRARDAGHLGPAIRGKAGER